MSGRLSDSDANNVLDTRFGGVASNAPATYYVGLSTGYPGNDGSGTVEPVGGAYARVAVVNNATNFPAATGRSKSNGVPVAFATATGSWGVVYYFVLYDAATAGNFRAWGTLSTGQGITSGSTASFAPGALVINAPGD